MVLSPKIFYIVRVVKSKQNQHFFYSDLRALSLSLTVWQISEIPLHLSKMLLARLSRIQD